MLSSGLQLSLAVTSKASVTNLFGSAGLQSLALNEYYVVFSLPTELENIS